MLTVLREVQHPQKSWAHTASDLVLRPFNYLVGNRAITLQTNGIWSKVNWSGGQKVYNYALIFFSLIFTLIASPVIVLAILYKATSFEPRWVTQSYQVWKKQMAFQMMGVRILHVQRSNDLHFTFEIQHPSLKTETVSFNWQGKMDYKNYFTSSSAL